MYSHPQQELISDGFSRFVHQWDEEFDEVKKTRRAGRPASVREDLLKLRITALLKEEQDGFCEQ